MTTFTPGPFTVSAIGLGPMPFWMGNNEKPNLDRAIAHVAGPALVELARLDQVRRIAAAISRQSAC